MSHEQNLAVRERIREIERDMAVDDPLVAEVLALVEKQKPTRHNHYGWVFVWEAAHQGHAHLVQQIIERATKPAGQLFDMHNLGLDYAMEKNWTDVGKVLIPHIDPFSITHVNWTQANPDKIDMMRTLLARIAAESYLKIETHPLINDIRKDVRTLLFLGGKQQKHSKDMLRLLSDHCMAVAPSLEVCFDTACYLGASYLDDFSDVEQKDIFGSLIKRIIEDHNRPNFHLDDEEWRIRDDIYQRCLDFALSYTDEQLDVFIPRQIHTKFWAIHDRHRQRAAIAQSITSLGTTPPPSKM